MKEKHTFLAFDCGATSGRGVLATFDGASFRMEEVYRFPSEMIRKDGRMYWDVLAMRDHFVACLQELEQKGIRPDSIGIDTWGVDFGCVGADGSLLGLPRCYRDPYTEGIPEKVYEKMPREDLYALTGIQIMNFNSIFQLYAQTLAHDEALRDAAALLFMPDLLSYLLTGNKVCEYTDASTSGMMDQASRQFNKGLLEKLGIRTDMLLPIVQPGTKVGEYRGIPVIAVAGHDTASAIAAVPAADERFVLAGGEQDRERDRQVEMGTFLADVGRGEVHGDPAAERVETGVRHRGRDAVPALLDRGVGQADDDGLRIAGARNVGLDENGDGLDPAERA